VPNAALRVNPAAAAAAATASPGIVSQLLPRPPSSGQAPRRAGTDTSRVRQVWVLKDGQPQPVPVTPGVTDGRTTEVTSEQLQAGMDVIVDQTTKPK
jgi:HlyD family secretion protein